MQSEDHPYTCVGCSLAFSSTDAQRLHYGSDLHRYNAKRRIAGLSPVTAEVYNQKIVERRDQLAQNEKAAADRIPCDACGKHFSSTNAYQDHLNSRKHKEQEARSIAKAFSPDKMKNGLASAQVEESKSNTKKQPETTTTENMQVDDNDADALKQMLAQKAEFATTIPELECLFCPRTCQSWPSKLKHMHAQHGFFIPDREYLVDEHGLVAHLAEIISVWNICLTCGLGFGQAPSNDDTTTPERKSRMARVALDAVRKHMCSKNHCKILWDTEDQRLELSDYYDFTTSYGQEAENPTEEWEDVDGSDGEEADMVVDETQHNDRPEVPKYGDTPFELVLPSGRRIGHRALQGFYKQNLIPAFNRQDEQEQHRLLLLEGAARQEGDEDADAFDSAVAIRQRNGQIMNARNPGEARWATKNDFAESKSRHLYQAKIGKVGNNQKHFRDFLLQ